MTTAATQHGQWFEMVKAQLRQLGRVGSGNWFWVDSNNGTDQARSGEEPADPVATLDYANGLCAANNDDVVVAMPGHAETYGAAGALTLDTAGVTYIALGWGTSTMPKITFSGAVGADVEVDAAGVIVSGFHFFNSQDALSGAIDMDAAYCEFRNCIFEDDGVNNTLKWFVLDANADRCVIADNKFWCTDTAGNTSAISIDGACDHVEILRNQINGDFSAACVTCTAAATDLLIDRNWLENANAVDVCIEGFAGITGWISRNMCRIATDGQTTWINTPGNASLFENYGVNDNGETGKLIGTASV